MCSSVLGALRFEVATDICGENPIEVLCAWKCDSQRFHHWASLLPFGNRCTKTHQLHAILKTALGRRPNTINTCLPKTDGCSTKRNPLSSLQFLNYIKRIVVSVLCSLDHKMCNSNTVESTMNEIIITAWLHQIRICNNFFIIFFILFLCCSLLTSIVPIERNNRRKLHQLPCELFGRFRIFGIKTEVYSKDMKFFWSRSKSDMCNKVFTLTLMAINASVSFQTIV